MATVQPVRHSQVWIWTLIGLLALFLVLVVLKRVAGAEPIDPQPDPVAAYIVSPSTGMFVAGPYRGAAPYVGVGSELEPGTVVGNVEVWGKLHPVYSMVSGRVLEVLAPDDAMVVTRQPLFRVQIDVEPTPA
jgi:biotin carboxyl carrier protein